MVKEVMNSRRSKLEIYRDVLEQIKGGLKTPTHIMHKTNLSWKIIHEYLLGLELQELIKECGGIHNDKRKRNSYLITEKGENFLNYFNKAIIFLESNVDRGKNWRPYPSYTITVTHERIYDQLNS